MREQDTTVPSEAREEPEVVMGIRSSKTRWMLMRAPRDEIVEVGCPKCRVRARERCKLREGTEVIVVFPPERVMNALPRLDPDAPPQAETNPQRQARSAA